MVFQARFIVVSTIGHLDNTLPLKLKSSGISEFYRRVCRMISVSAKILFSSSCISVICTAIMSFQLPYLSLAFAVIVYSLCLLWMSKSTKRNKIDLQLSKERAANGGTTPAVIDPTQFTHLRDELMQALSECEQSIANVKSTQDDAINTLSLSFLSLQTLVYAHTKTIKKIMKVNTATDEEHSLSNASSRCSIAIQADTISTANLEKISCELEVALADAVRSLQFADVNGQNLLFILNTFELIKAQIADLCLHKIVQAEGPPREHEPDLQRINLTSSNPVSTSNMQAGEIKFF